MSFKMPLLRVSGCLFCLVFISCISTNHAKTDSSLERSVAADDKAETSKYWTHYAADAKSSKFSWLNQIDATNVKNLKLAWKWNSIDNEIIQTKALDTSYYEATPIMVNDMLYTSTSLNQVVALNPATGEKIWSYDPKTYEAGFPGNSGFVHRGVAYWERGSKKRILIGTNDAYLISLDANTGEPTSDFGNAGRVDLTLGLRRPVERPKYGVTSPPIICRDTVIVGSSISDFFYKNEMPPGDVRGFDVSTGKLKWTFHTIPQDLEKGTSTWKNDSWKKFGNTNVWAPMSADLDLGSVFLSVSTPSNDFYGGERPGNNLYGDSLVSLNCETGKRNWHFQMVHHGLWDYDPPAAPILMDIKVNGKPIKAIAEVTKQAFTYVFDRVTGKPVWPINETPVPQSNVVGEMTSKTQPVPTKPAPFDRQGLSENDLLDFSGLIDPSSEANNQSLKQEVKNTVDQYHWGSLFTPPSTDKGTIQVPGTFGGASWAGAAYSPVTGKLYIPSVSDTYVSAISSSPPGSDFKYTTSLLGSKYLKSPSGLPMTKPPYGRITAIDMSSGEHSWMSPIGRGPKDILESKGVKLISEKDLGWNRRTHVMATPNLLFAVQSGKLDIVGVHLNGVMPNSYKIKVTNDEPVLRALDPNTGETIAKIQLPSNSYAAPMTYMYHDKQYVIVPVGGGGLNTDAAVMAFALE